MRLCLAVALTFGLSPAVCAEPSARFVGAYEWQHDFGWFGGFSGLELSADGAEFVAITDAGMIVNGHIVRDENGAVNGLQRWAASPLVTSANDNAEADANQDRFFMDAEGLAVDPNGRLTISFERFPRLWSYDDVDGISQWLPRIRDLDLMKHNRSLEALAVDAQNRLWTLPEAATGTPAAFPVFIYADGLWNQPFSVPASDGFSMVGADFGPDGRLYLLERGLSLFGFRSRIRRLEINGDSPGLIETILETDAGVHDNLEGISVWRDDDGATRLTLISDDNFKFFQRTELVDYIVQ